MSLEEYRRIERRAKSERKRSLSRELRDLLLAQLRAAGIREPDCGAGGRPEHRFHPTRKWRHDLFWLEERIAVEIEGGTYGRAGAKKCRCCGQVPQGGHNTGDGYERNLEKYNEARLAGTLLLQVTRTTINDGRAISWIRRAFADRADADDASTPRGESAWEWTREELGR